MCPYILPLPVISQTAMLFLLYGVNDLLERLRVVDGEVSENFTVKVDAFFLHTSNELRVGETKFARSVVDTGNPEGAEIALFVATITIRIAQSFDDALLGEAEATGAIMLHPLGGG